MATNLVSLVMQFLTPDMIGKIASALRLDRMTAQKAIGGAVPAILSSLAGVASAPGGARQLSNAVTQQGSGMLDRLGSLVGGPGQAAFTETGASTLSGLLGDGSMDTLTQSIGKFANIGDGPTKSLLGMLGPVVLGALGQQQRSAGLDAGGLASLLTSQKEQITSAIPSGLMDHLDTAGFMEQLRGGVRSGSAAAGAAAGRIGSAVESTAMGAYRPYAMRNSAGWQWPALALGAIVLAGVAWYLIANGGGEKVADATPAVATQTGRPMETAPVALTTPGLMVGGVNLANKVTTSVSGLKSTLSDIKDAGSAEAAMPKLRDAMAQLDDVRTLSAKLPPEGKSALAKLIAAAMPTVNQLFDQVLAMPGVSGVAKPAIDELRGKLDTLAKA